MVTNDDKLRRLREWLRTETFPTVRRDTDAILEMVENKIDRLLAEPTSPAPAAAPSGRLREAAQVVCDAESNIADWIVDHEDDALPMRQSELRSLERLREQAIGRLRETLATAPAASPPVTSEAIEAAITEIEDEASELGELNAYSDTTLLADQRKAQVARLEQAEAKLRALIAAAITEVRSDVCTGCGSPRITAIEAVAKGKAACCPDCSTLSVDERNAIRNAIPEARGSSGLPWVRLKATSPSGKTLFCCTSCGRVSPTPDSTCKTIGDPDETWKCSARFAADAKEQTK